MSFTKENPDVTRGKLLTNYHIQREQLQIRIYTIFIVIYELFF